MSARGRLGAHGKGTHLEDNVTGGGRGSGVRRGREKRAEAADTLTGRAVRVQ